jgi:hypothetical protein
MRLSTVLLECCALVQLAAAKDAYLYTFDADRQNPSTTSQIISPYTALSIAARRRGATDNLSLKGIDEAALSQISEHGGYQQHLFSESTNTAPPRVLVRIQADRPEMRSNTHTSPALQIEKPTKDLLTGVDVQGVDVMDYTFESYSKEKVKLVCRVHQKARVRSHISDCTD